MTGELIRLEKISVIRNGYELLSDISLTVASGEVCILAGWEEEQVRALFSVLSGSLIPDSGEVFLMGKRDDRKKTVSRKGFGFLIEKPFYYEKLDARENLSAIQSLQRKELRRTSEEMEELLVLTGLNGIGSRGRSLASYSDGMKACYGIAAALLVNPEVLVLEGILDGMGQEDTERVWEVLRSLKERGLTMLLSTSDREAEKWKFGRIVKKGAGHEE